MYDITYNLDELNVLTDLKNIRQVIVGKMSTPEYTFLDLVYRHMVKSAKVDQRDFLDDFQNPNNIKRVRIRLAGYIQKLNWITVWDARILIKRPIELNESPTIIENNSRPQRQRRAPNRLNIASTKGRSYN